MNPSVRRSSIFKKIQQRTELCRSVPKSVCYKSLSGNLPFQVSYSYSGQNMTKKINAIPHLAIYIQGILMINSKALNITTIINLDVRCSLCKIFCHLVSTILLSRISILIHYIGKSLLRHDVLLWSSMTLTAVSTAHNNGLSAHF